MRPSIITILAVALAACAGPVPGDPTTGPDPGGGGGGDAGAGAAVQRLSGRVLDYFSNATPVVDAIITSDAIDPEMSATSVADGAYAFDGVPSTSKVFLVPTHAQYVATRNPVITVGETAVVQDLFMLSEVDVARQYTRAALSPMPDSGFVIVELARTDGAPITGVGLADLSLVDLTGAPVAGIAVSFFGALGDVDPAITTSTAFGGRARAAMFGVPSGSYMLQVRSPGTAQAQLVPVIALADGATLVSYRSGDSTGPGTGTPSFARDIYPRLQPLAAGGLGCASCHTAGGQGAVLPYDGPPASVLANINAAPGVVNLASPASSLFLTKPLYEPAPYNHPNAQFLDVNDPDYRLFLAWIQGGAVP